MLGDSLIKKMIVSEVMDIIWSIDGDYDLTPVLEVTPTLSKARPIKNIEIPKETCMVGNTVLMMGGKKKKILF